MMARSGDPDVWMLFVIASAFALGLIKKCSPERAVRFRNRKGRQDL